MSRFFIEAAELLWRVTPSKSVREFYLYTFLRLARNRKTVATLEGMTLALDLGEMIDVCVYLQKFERDVVGAIERFCRPGWVVLDIGANIGAHSLRFAKATGPQGKVYSFEPTDFAYRKLQKNISLNAFSHVYPFQIALADQNLRKQNINFRSSWRTDGKRVEGSGFVDLVRLDDWCLENKVERVDLIKLDVDGNEFSVLSGGRELLNRVRPLLFMEIGGWHFEDPSRNPLQILRDMDYRFWEIKSLAEFSDLEAIRRFLSEKEKQKAESINLIAGARCPVSIAANKDLDKSGES